jgi:glutaredoxin
MAHLEHMRFQLYTRPGCHLCEVALQHLTRAQERYQFALVVVDVDTDPELTARYGDQVPVVTVNGKVRFRGAVNAILLTRLLRAEAEKAASRK